MTASPTSAPDSVSHAPAAAAPVHKTAVPAGNQPAGAAPARPVIPAGSKVEPAPAAADANQATADATQSGTVIEDRTIRPRQAAGATPSSTLQGNASGKAANPLSLFKEGDQAEVEDYQFEPIDHFESKSNDPDAEAESPSDDAAFLTTQEIDTSDYIQQDDGQQDFQKTLVMSAPPGQESGAANDQAPMQNPDDAATAAAKPDAEPRKSEYVTESLI